MSPVTLVSSFLSDRALDPVKQLAGPVHLPPVHFFVFYMKDGRMWGSDGAGHTPVNPALMASFDQLFQAEIAKNGRGSLHSILSGNEISRYCIVTDNHTNRATFLEYETAIRFALINNFPVHAPDVPT